MAAGVRRSFYIQWMSTSEIATVLAWHDALNDSKVDTVLLLSSVAIEIGSADGAAQGLAALREWATDPGVTLRPGQMYYRDGMVVVEETATGTSTAHAPSVTEAASFRVVDDVVTSIFRHATVDDALAASGMSTSDLVSDS